MQYLKNDVREKILKAAIAEFKENGYANASIRNIAVNAHISLGNIYRYFTNKEALYCAVVEPLMEEIVRKIDSEFEHGNVEAKDVSDATVDFIWENRDIAKILIDGAEGTRYVNFREDACTKMEQILNERFQKECGQEVDHELVHILVQMKFQGYCELLRGNCSREKLLEISRILQICSSQCLLAIEAELNRKQ